MGKKYWTESPKVESRWLALCELHGKKLSPGLTAIYMDILQNMKEETAAQILEYQIRQAKWFPKPADLMETANGTLEEQAFRAWQILIDAIKKIGPYQSIYFEDQTISQIVEHFNGWLEVCNWTNAELPFRRKEFMGVYKYAKGASSSKIHCGILEMSNRRRGYFSNIPEPYLITSNGSILKIPQICSSTESSSVGF